MNSVSDDITSMLQAWAQGDSDAPEQLMPVVFDELRTIASRCLRRESPVHTLQPTALVNELYLRLLGQRELRWENRAHFFALSARLMRRILVDHARARQREKRGGGASRLSLDQVELPVEPDLDLVALDEALTALATVDARQARVVELRFFVGLTMHEISEVLEVSPRTVKRAWQAARCWLFAEMERS